MAAAERQYEERVEFASKAAPKDGSASHANTLADAWVAAAGQSDLGNTSSYNDGPRLGGFHYEHAVRHGVRESTARQFLLPLLRQGAPNLDVVVGAHVNRVLLDVGASPARAIGVDVSFKKCILPSVSVPILGQLLPSRPCLLGSRQATRREYTKANGYRREVLGVRYSARKEVIISAGAYESPHLLLRSGIGPSEQLRAASVRQHVELPAVGSHLQDHPIIGIKYRGSGPSAARGCPPRSPSYGLPFRPRSGPT
jgi:choline dehydrogenase